MIAVLFLLAAVAAVASSSTAKLAHWIQPPSVDDPGVQREGGSFDDTFTLMRAPSGKGFQRTLTVAALPSREGSLEADITWSTRSGTQLCYAVRFRDDLVLGPGSKLRGTGDGQSTWLPCNEGQNVIDSVKIGDHNFGPNAAYMTKVFVADGRLLVQIFTPYDWRQTFMLHVRWEHTTRVE